jgi:hypothetical protein
MSGRGRTRVLEEEGGKGILSLIRSSLFRPGYLNARVLSFSFFKLN